jgi:hypothetical protein
MGRRTKPPSYTDDDATKFAPIIKSSWGQVMDALGYFELGCLYYDTVFADAQDISVLFTRGRCSETDCYCVRTNCYCARAHLMCPSCSW